MSHFDHLMATRDKVELAKLVVALAKENASLRDEAGALSHEVFWLQVALRKLEKEVPNDHIPRKEN